LTAPASVQPGAAGDARLFIALWPDTELRGALGAWCGQWRWGAAAKPVTAERLHLTLHFIGGVPRTRLHALREALSVPFAPFALSLGRPALWPGGIAVLEPECVPARLHRLHVALGKALQDLGLPVEARIFRPHLTLARKAGVAQAPALGPRLRWPVRGYALVESLAPAQGGYVVLQAYA
jgi:2'-5' RNA ligase